MAFRGAPRYVIVCSVVSYFPTFPKWVLEKEVSGAKNIGEFGGPPPKYGGFQSGAVKFRRAVPWCARRRFVCVDVSYLSELPDRVFGNGLRAP